MPPGEKPRIPSSTCRLQFHRGFTLRDAMGIVDVLEAIGFSHVYASPLLRARPGSTHGYDLVDPSMLNPEIGTDEELERFAGLLRERGMGLVVDIVPNHMCIADPLNTWWFDVLENGPSSPFARFFDIDWQPPKEELADRVLLPVLGDQFGAVLERGEIAVSYEAGMFEARYWGQRYPLAPKSWPAILEPVLARLRDSHGGDHEHIAEIESILNALDHLPGRTETNPERARERQREKQVIRRRLGALSAGWPSLAAEIAAEVRALNGTPGVPSSFDRLDALLANQGYRLCYWSVAADEINYRRFFDVNELAAIRVEEPDVFRALHAHVLEWAARGWIDGLRIDHVDGLYDPSAYLSQLRDAFAASAGRPAWIVAEKILGAGETLPASWHVHGTTGYDFLNDLNGLLVDPHGHLELERAWETELAPLPPIHEQVATCRKLIMLVSLSAELHVLARRLDRISEQRRESRDFTRESLRFALREATARLPVYRTYARGLDPIGEDDRRRVERAVEEAKERNPATNPSLWEFVKSVWVGDAPKGLTGSQAADRREFVLRLQQFTPPVAAKGMEDTFFYRHAPLMSVNEVGADPEGPAVEIGEFHRRMSRRARELPWTMNATSTHDTKRSEDARARLDVLSEIPEAWLEAVRRWRGLNAAFRSEVDGVVTPGPLEEEVFFQALIATRTGPGSGGGEDYGARVEAYMLKAVREAKLRTSWISPRQGYEAAVTGYVRRAMAPSHAFLADFDAFLAPVARAGLMNALAQVVLKAAAPGVPDFYQGTERWSWRLVDPDNRGTVDWAGTREMLASLDRDAPPLARLLESAEDGRLKLAVTRAALGFRRSHPSMFESAGYEPLAVEGAPAGHVVAFARTSSEGTVVAVAARHLLRLGRGLPPRPADWGDAAVALPADPGGPLRCVLSGRDVAAPAGRLRLRDALDPLPVALLAPARPQAAPPRPSPR